MVEMYLNYLCSKWFQQNNVFSYNFLVCSFAVFNKKHLRTHEYFTTPVSSPIIYLGKKKKKRKCSDIIYLETSFTSWRYLLKLQPMFWTLPSGLESYNLWFYLSEKTLQILQLEQNGIIRIFLSLSGLSMSFLSWRE